MRGAREAIEAGSYDDYVATCTEGWERGDIPAL
jgi:hypothetical protein